MREEGRCVESRSSSDSVGSALVYCEPVGYTRNRQITHVTHKRLDNYLKAYRRQSGLTQSEVAFLLGSENGEQVCRYEKRRALPPIETALDCEAVFGAPISELV